MSVVTPTLLTFTTPAVLSYSGGASAVGHIMDWRDMAARPTISKSAFHGLLDFSASNSWEKLRGAWAGGKHIGEVVEEKEGDPGSTQQTSEDSKDSEGDLETWDQGVDDKRGFLIGISWLIACAIE